VELIWSAIALRRWSQAQSGGPVGHPTPSG